MDAEIIKEGVKTARTRTRRVAGQAKRQVETQAARSSSDVVVALERAQRVAVDLGDRAAKQGERAYEQGERAARAAAREIGGRPWTAALVLGGTLLAGAASVYLMQSGRRR
jgi:hypothetical protein